MKMSEGDDTGRIRQEHLENVYKVLSDLMMNEDERFTDTLNIFVLVQTIIFAGFIQLNTLDQSLFSNNHVLLFLKNILPLIATLLCINGIYSFHRRVEAMKFWKAQIYRLEAEELIGEQYGKGLDIHIARKVNLEKKHSKYPRFIFDLLGYQRYFMAVVFLALWILILVSQIL
jgi:hypothetical protein